MYDKSDLVAGITSALEYRRSTGSPGGGASQSLSATGQGMLVEDQYEFSLASQVRKSHFSPCSFAPLVDLRFRLQILTVLAAHPCSRTGSPRDPPGENEAFNNGDHPFVVSTNGASPHHMASW